MESVCREMKINKTTGIDGIKNIALKAAIKSNTELFRQGFDACTQERMFHKLCRRQRLVLISKGKKSQNASGYRPLCMIDMAAKLLESKIYKRLETFLGEEG